MDPSLHWLRSNAQLDEERAAVAAAAHRAQSAEEAAAGVEALLSVQEHTLAEASERAERQALALAAVQEERQQLLQRVGCLSGQVGGECCRG